MLSGGLPATMQQTVALFCPTQGQLVLKLKPKVVLAHFRSPISRPLSTESGLIVSICPTLVTVFNSHLVCCIAR